MFDESGTEVVEGGSVPEGDTTSSGTAATTTEGDGTQQQAAVKDESFIDPADLPDEIKPHWSRMHRAYTKKLEEIKGIREKADTVDRFYSDPKFASETVEAWAKQNGYSLTKGQIQQVANQMQQTMGAPQQLVEAIRSRLSPAMQWMAEDMANAQWAAQETIQAPIKQQQQKELVERLKSEYEEISTRLSETSPGWEEHEDEMLDLKNFLESNQLKHKKFGSKLEILHSIVTKNAGAISEAARRMSDAGKNRVTTGNNNRGITPNIQDRIGKAKHMQDKWDLAAEAAIDDLKKQGIAI